MLVRKAIIPVQVLPRLDTVDLLRNIGAQPAIGKVGKTEQVQEAKVEVILPETIEKQVIHAMQSVHPYEEPAYDLFAIDEPVEIFGLGRVGELPQEISYRDICGTSKRSFPIIWT